MKRVIVNADDFGREASINSAIYDSFIAGNISDASLMVTLHDGLLDANNKKYKTLFGGTIGIHLCLTLGQPLTCGMKNNMKYCGTDGFFTSDGFRKKFGRISKKDFKYIVEEFCAQIEMAISSGWSISHVDTHQHIHMYPSILKAVFLVCKKYKLSPVRPFNASVSSNPLKRMVLRHNNGLISKHCHNVVDYFCDAERFARESNTFGGDYIAEIMVHPVYNSLGIVVDKTSLPVEECDDLSSIGELLNNIKITNFKNIATE